MHEPNNSIEGRAMTGDGDPARRFADLFGQTPAVYEAPGRVNLIGEHTDYSDGFVMPAAIGFFTRAWMAPRADRTLAVVSNAYGEHVELDLDHLPAAAVGRWSDYAIGVATMLTRSGVRLRGANVMIEGNVPLGAGLSSSASLEIALGYGLIDLAFDGAGPIDATQLALLCQKAENEFVGARCGIMDQFIVSHGKRGHAILLDCRSLEHRLLPLPAGVSLVVCNTMTKHSHASGEYNLRRAECEAGLRGLSKALPEARALRDVTLAGLEEHGRELPELLRRRCRHVVSENARVLLAAAALDRGDLHELGALMGESHRSLRDDFEVSCPELDSMVELARQVTGVYGARMTGGGFGGCAIALVAEGGVEPFRQWVQSGYERITGRRPEIYACEAAVGVGRVA
jgi:galactokinase